MKKVIRVLAAISVTAILTSGCPNPTNAVKDAIGGTTPIGGGATGDCSALLQCLAEKNPGQAATYQKAIEQLKALPNNAYAQICGVYDAVAKTYGCGS